LEDLADFLEKETTINIETLTALKRRIERIVIRNVKFFNTTTPGLTQVQQQEMQFNVWTFQCSASTV
jgi:hypothetical protein